MFDKIEELYIVPGEKKKILAAIDALKKDPHAPREISVRFTLHIHNEYPKHMHKGGAKSVVVNNATEEEKAAKDGFGKFVPAAPEEDES
jgi:hypothetical protein